MPGHGAGRELRGTGVPSEGVEAVRAVKRYAKIKSLPLKEILSIQGVDSSFRAFRLCGYNSDFYGDQRQDCLARRWSF